MKNVFQMLEREKAEYKIKAENYENDLEMYKKTFDSLSRTGLGDKDEEIKECKKKVLFY